MITDFHIILFHVAVLQLLTISRKVLMSSIGIGVSQSIYRQICCMILRLRVFVKSRTGLTLSRTNTAEDDSFESR